MEVKQGPKLKPSSAQKKIDTDRDPINILIEKHGKEKAIKLILNDFNYVELIPFLMAYLETKPITDEKFTPHQKANLDFYQKVYLKTREKKIAPPTIEIDKEQKKEQKTEQKKQKPWYQFILSFALSSKPKPEPEPEPEPPVPDESIQSLITVLETKHKPQHIQKALVPELTRLYTGKAIRPTHFQNLHNFKAYTNKFLKDLLVHIMLETKSLQALQNIISYFYSAHPDSCNKCKVHFFRHHTPITTLLYLLYDSTNLKELDKLIELIILAIKKEEDTSLHEKTMPDPTPVSSSSSHEKTASNSTSRSSSSSLLTENAKPAFTRYSVSAEAKAKAEKPTPINSKKNLALKHAKYLETSTEEESSTKFLL